MARHSSDSSWQSRFDLKLRYRLIEIIALWEGRLTSKTLIQAFGIGRQQASKDINFYNSEIAPGNLHYDTHLKGYRPSADFVCRLTRGDINEYLHLLASRQDELSKVEFLDLNQANLSSIQPPLRAIRADFVRPIIEAARDKKRVEIQYTSLTQPQPKDRMIAPHTIVFNGYRWHVRAFCEESLMFKDFLLSRMTDISEITLDASQDVAQDTDWNTPIDIEIQPDPRLTQAQQKVIATDYAMKNNRLVISTRAALVTYYLQLLRVDKAMPHPNPKAQQIQVANREVLASWLLPD